MRRLSIKMSMGYLGLIAVALAALRNANAAWAAIIQLLTIGAVASAILGVVQQRGKNREWWAGFAFFAGGYLLLALGPWFSANVRPDLATSRLFEYVCQPALSPNTYQESWKTEDQNVAEHLQRLTIELRINPARSDVAAEIEQIQSRKRLGLMIPGLRNAASFERIGHYLSALMAGLIGAVISSRLYCEPDPPARD